jgi:WD40 repeat protein
VDSRFTHHPHSALPSRFCRDDMKVVLFLLVLTHFWTETSLAQVRSSPRQAPQDAGSAERPSIALPCRGDDSYAPGTQGGEATQPIIQSGHAGTITTMTFSPRSTLLATGSQDGTVKLWSVQTGQLLRSFSVSGYWIYSVAFSPNGCTLAAGSGDHKIYRWNLDTNTQVPPLDAQAGAFKAVAFSLDGTLLTSGTMGGGTNPRPSAMARSGGNITTLSNDGKWTALSSGPEIILRSNSNHRERRLPSSQALGVSAVQLSESGSLMAAGLRDGQISVWDKPSRATYRSLQASEDGFSQAIRALSFNPATNTMLGASRTGGVVKWNLASSQPPQLIREPAQGVRVDSLLDTREELGLARPLPPRAFQVSIDGVPQNPGTEETLVTAIATTGTIAAGGLYFDSTITTGYVSLSKPGANRPAPRFTDARRGTDDVTALAFSSDGSRLAVGFSSGGIDILNVLDQSIVTRLDGHRASINALAFSPNGELLASGSVDKMVGLWNPKVDGPGRFLPGHEAPVLCVSLSEDALLASGSADNKILLWKTESGTLVTTLEGHTSAVNALAFAPGQKILVSGGDDATLRFWDTSKFQLLAILLPVSGGPDWLTTTPNGFFDGSEGAWGQVLWQFNRDLFDVSPVEIGFRDYFVPNLLAKVLGGQAPAIPRSLATLNRVQPIVRVLSVTPDSPGTVQVNVEVEGTTSKTHTDVTGLRQQSGVYDLRMFRNRQLSGRWPDVAEGASPSSDQGLEAWRKLHSVPLQPDAKAVVSFDHVRVPQNSKMHKIDFTAYAFNSDRVKSLTSDPFEYALPKSSTAATRRAYLVTVGVNANQSHNLNLELAVSSAESVRALLRMKLKSEYPEVDEIPLYSDLDPDTNRVKSKTATKADLKAVLDLLAGRAVDQNLREEVDPKHQLQTAAPDDAVVLYIASHGYADPKGTFYLMPYDTGSNWGITEDVLTRCQIHPDRSLGCAQAKDLLNHSVSSFDLAAWWTGVDAGEMVMILDSCHSGAVPGSEFRPGPLGDPGFGQLSYDKGMVILSASQRAQTEKGEWVSGGGGRTLLVDALKTVAQMNPQHTVQQWLHDAQQQLPMTAKHLYPTLKEEEVPLPVLLDFAGRISNAAGGGS